MSLAFRKHDVYWTIAPGALPFFQDVTPSAFTVEVDGAAITAPNQGHPAGGFRGEDNTVNGCLRKCNFPFRGTQGDQAHRWGTV